MDGVPLFESLDEGKRLLIEKHLRCVLEANKTMNLTRIQDYETGMILHVEDSLQAMEEMECAPEGMYGDLGSGAGFPGFPLGVACERETLLIDAREKKMKAVKGIIDKLGTGNQIDVFTGRAELLARRKPAQFAVLTARALSKLPVLLELASPLLQMGGHLVCFKANVKDHELKDAEHVSKLVGMKKTSDRSFMLAGEYSRCIIVFEKVGASKVRLPRSEGMAQRKPLVS